MRHLASARRPAKWVAAAVVSVPLLLHVEPARATGVYEDVAGYAGFLTGSHRAGIRAAMVRTDDERRNASLFIVSASYPLRDNLLVQFEQPYVAVDSPADIRSGFGDGVARARLRILGGEGSALHLLGGLRLGTGSRRFYPYSSQSLDAALGVGFVDTLDVLQVWGAASGVAVMREPPGLDEATRHENYAHLAAGLTIPLLASTDLRVGFTGLVFRSGAARDLFLGQIGYRPSPSLEIRASAQAEAGKPEERVSDLAATVEIAARF
jgi:hypothetical protein